MRITIDATPLLLRSAGVKTYVYQWIAHLRKLAGADEILTFPFFGRIGELQHEKSMAGGWRTLAGLALLHLCNHSGHLAVDLVGSRVDVFHASHQLRNAPRNTRVTATLYDMTCWLVPEMHSAANVRVGREFGENVLKRADGLIAISENTRKDAIEILDLAPERVEVIYPGVADAYFAVSPDMVQRVQAKYGLSHQYLLFVGTIEPRKNVDTLLDAYQDLDRALRHEYDLVIAGPSGWASPSTLARLGSGLAGIHHLGYVPEEDLPALTGGATAFVYPSLYEGFGFPVAQAMAAGVPVITSDLSSLPEIAGGSALLVDPKSTAELRPAMERMLTSPELRQELSARGRERAHFYRWSLAAEKSLEFFRRVTQK